MTSKNALQVLAKPNPTIQGKAKNLVTYDQAEKKLILSTTGEFEFTALDGAYRSVTPTRRAVVELAAAGSPKRWQDLIRLARRFDKSRYEKRFDFSLFNAVIPNFDLDGEYPYIQIPRLLPFSEGKVSFALGEGMLDFLYIDFSKIQIDPDSFTSRPPVGKKFRPENNAERRIEDCLHLAYTIGHFSKVIYSSVYTTAFPPFMVAWTEKTLSAYLAYLKGLQEKLAALIEFVFDPDFYPEVLGDLSENKRYAYFCTVNGLSTKCLYTYSFDCSFRPTGSPILEFTRIAGPEFGLVGTSGTPQQQEFYERFRSDSYEKKRMSNMPDEPVSRFQCASIEEMLMFEFWLMLENGVKLRKCKRCGRYFVMKGNYDTNYCDRIPEGETRNCQQLAAQDNYKKKMADNAAIPLYQKYYKRYAARLRVKQIKPDQFKKWKLEAMTKRDACSDGKITVEEYENWLEGCFPNRTKRK